MVHFCPQGLGLRHLFSPPIYLMSQLSPSAAAVVTSKLCTLGKGHTSCSQNSSLQVLANELTTSNSLVSFFFFPSFFFFWSSRCLAWYRDGNIYTAAPYTLCAWQEVAVVSRKNRFPFDFKTMLWTLDAEKNPVKAFSIVYYLLIHSKTITRL